MKNLANMCKLNEPRKLIFQVLTVFFIGVIVFFSWTLYVVPESEKIPESYSLDMEYEGQNQIVDDVYGKLSEPFLLRDTLSQKIIGKNGDELTISSTVSSRRADTNQVLFRIDNTYKVDAKTRMHLDKGKLFEFLPKVEKKDYDFFHPAVFYDDPMVFKGTDFVNGLQVYVFDVTTKGADTSRAFPQFSPHVIFTDTTSRLWVEPTTGNLVRFEKNWENYLVENGQRINTVEIGGKKTTPFTELILTQFTKAKIQNIHFNQVIMPSLLSSIIFISGFAWILATNLGRINKEKTHLEETEKLKDELATMMGHEIRNPLTPILITCNLLLSAKYGPINDSQREKLEIILKNSNRLNDLLSDFTDIKKLDLDRLKLSKTEVDLKDYLETVVESMRPFTGEKNIQFNLNLEGSWKITCDQKRISQVISNLVKNAIDFVPKNNGKITINAEQETKGTVISVEDNGIGVISSNAEIIFDRFKQLENPSYIKHEGSGLGLAVCKGIIEAHGGQIWLDDSYENGARFKFFIPNI